MTRSSSYDFIRVDGTAAQINPENKPNDWYVTEHSIEPSFITDVVYLPE